MHKWVSSYFFPLVILIIFIFIMQGGCYYIYSLPDKDLIPRHVNQLETDLKAGQWDNAREDLQQLDTAWEKVIPAIQLHAEMDAIDGIKADLARLNGSIEAKDPGLALAEINELFEHWENLKN